MGRAWLARASAALMALAFGAWDVRADVSAEAEATAKQLWGALLTKCGDDYFYAGSVFDSSGGLAKLEAQNKQPRVIEFKGAQFAVVPVEMSQAQQLNGIEYIGRMVMVSSAFRDGIGGNWGAWLEGPAGRVVRNGQDIVAGALGDFMGDAFELGSGGLIPFNLVKVKGVWAVSRGSSISVTIGGDKFVAAEKVAAYANKYDCAASAIIPSEAQVAAQKAQAEAYAQRQAALEARMKAQAESAARRQAELEAQRKAQAEEAAARRTAFEDKKTPVRDPKKGIGFIVIAPSEFALMQQFAAVRRAGSRNSADRASYLDLLAEVRKIADRFPGPSKVTDDQYLAPNTTYKDVVLDNNRAGTSAFRFFGSKALVLVMVTSGPYRNKYVAIETANYSANLQVVPGGR